MKPCAAGLEVFTEPEVYVDSVFHDGLVRSNSRGLGWERWVVSKITTQSPNQTPLFGLSMLTRPPIDDSANYDANESDY